MPVANVLPQVVQPKRRHGVAGDLHHGGVEFALRLAEARHRCLAVGAEHEAGGAGDHRHGGEDLSRQWRQRQRQRHGGSLCGLPGMVHTPSAPSSPCVMPATSRNRAPVSSRILTNGPNGGPSRSQACQNATTSAAVSTRSRSCRRARALHLGARVARDLALAHQPAEQNGQRGVQPAAARFADAVVAAGEARECRACARRRRRHARRWRRSQRPAWRPTWRPDEPLITSGSVVAGSAPSGKRKPERERVGAPAARALFVLGPVVGEELAHDRCRRCWRRGPRPRCAGADAWPCALRRRRRRAHGHGRSRWPAGAPGRNVSGPPITGSSEVSLSDRSTLPRVSLAGSAVRAAETERPALRAAWLGLERSGAGRARGCRGSRAAWRCAAYLLRTVVIGEHGHRMSSQG